MPNIYCPSCGEGFKYLYSKPESCPSCKHSFAIKIDFETTSEPERETTTQVSTSFRKKISAPKQINVEIDAPIFEKLGSVIGSNPGETRSKRKPIGKNDYKRQVFKSAPSEITDA